MSLFLCASKVFVGDKGSTVALYHTHPLWRHTEKVAKRVSHQSHLADFQAAIDSNRKCQRKIFDRFLDGDWDAQVRRVVVVAVSVSVSVSLSFSLVVSSSFLHLHVSPFLVGLGWT